MRAKSSILSFRPLMPIGNSRTVKDRRPTAAERAYVRAKARQAAQAIFEIERCANPEHRSDPPCE